MAFYKKFKYIYYDTNWSKFKITKDSIRYCLKIQAYTEKHKNVRKQ